LEVGGTNLNNYHTYSHFVDVMISRQPARVPPTGSGRFDVVSRHNVTNEEGKKDELKPNVTPYIYWQTVPQYIQTEVLLTDQATFESSLIARLFIITLWILGLVSHHLNILA
jgi:hypothetical protein